MARIEATLTAENAELQGIRARVEDRTDCYDILAHVADPIDLAILRLGDGGWTIEEWAARCRELGADPRRFMPQLPADLGA
jgi:hypothetical protein